MRADPGRLERVVGRALKGPDDSTRGGHLAEDLRKLGRRSVPRPPFRFALPRRRAVYFSPEARAMVLAALHSVTAAASSLALTVSSPNFDAAAAHRYQVAPCCLKSLTAGRRRYLGLGIADTIIAKVSQPAGDVRPSSVSKYADHEIDSRSGPALQPTAVSTAPSAAGYRCGERHPAGSATAVALGRELRRRSPTSSPSDEVSNEVGARLRLRLSPQNSAATKPTRRTLKPTFIHEGDVPSATWLYSAQRNEIAIDLFRKRLAGPTMLWLVRSSRMRTPG